MRIASCLPTRRVRTRFKKPSSRVRLPRRTAPSTGSKSPKRLDKASAKPEKASPKSCAASERFSAEFLEVGTGNTNRNWTNPGSSNNLKSEIRNRKLDCLKREVQSEISQFRI